MELEELCLGIDFFTPTNDLGKNACRSKNTNFNRLLIFLSVADIFLIVFFLLMSSSTVLSDPPQWFVVLFPYVLW